MRTVARTCTAAVVAVVTVGADLRARVAHAGAPGTERERGASLVEYLFLLILIAMAVIGAVMFMRGQLSEQFDVAGSRVSEAPNP